MIYWKRLHGSAALICPTSEVVAIVIITNGTQPFIFVMQHIDFLLQQKPC